MKKSRINVSETFIPQTKRFFQSFWLEITLHLFFFFFQSISLFHKDLGFFLVFYVVIVLS